MSLKNNIVADGRWRLERGQRELSIESVRQRSAAEIASATGDHKQQLEEKVVADFLRQKNHKPSRKTLW